MTSAENTPVSPAPGGDKPPKRKQSVMTYLVVLFAVAFLLLLFSHLMQRRDSQATINSLQQRSISAVQSLENIMKERDALKEENATLQIQLSGAQRAAAEATEELHTANSIIAALDAVNQLQALCDDREYTQARELLSGLEAAGATRKALEEYVSRCPEDQLELYDPLEHYDTLVDRLN